MQSAALSFGTDYDLQGWLKRRKEYCKKKNKPLDLKKEIERFKKMDRDHNGIVTEEERDK
jgi:hypothetical protein